MFIMDLCIHQGIVFPKDVNGVQKTDKFIKKKIIVNPVTMHNIYKCYKLTNCKYEEFFSSLWTGKHIDAQDLSIGVLIHQPARQ